MGGRSEDTNGSSPGARILDSTSQDAEGPGGRGEQVLGRERELDLLGRFVDDLAHDAAAFVLRGEAGIGKTTLWKAGLRKASNKGHQVLSCRPVEAEAKLPFAALGDLLDEVSGEALAQLPPPQRQAIDFALLRTESEGPPPDQRAVSVAVLGLFRQLAEARPLVIAIDDVPWLDRPSHRVLEFTARRLSGTRVGLLLGLRGGAEESLPLGIERALAADRLTLLDLEPLPMHAIDSLLRSRLATAFRRPTLLRLMQISKGNPFFALELGRALLRRGIALTLNDPLPVPENLRQLVAARLGRLPQSQRAILLVASALSHPTVDLLSSATGGEAGELLEDMNDRGIVQLDSQRVAFAHPLLASTLYADAGDRERREIHRRLAGVVSDPVERARHLALATIDADETAAEAIEDAAREALGRAAPETAAELAEQALRLTPPERSEVARRRQVEAGEYHLHAGDRDRARTLVEEAISGARPGVVRARGVHALALIRVYDAGPHAGVQPLVEAVEDAQDDPSLWATIQTELAALLFQAGQVRSANEHAQLGLGLAEARGDEAILAWARPYAAWTAFLLGHGYQVELLDEGPLTTSDPPARSAPYPTFFPLEPGFLEALMLKWSDDFPRGRARLEELRRRKLERNEENSLLGVLFQLGELECWAGEWTLAERYERECRDVAAQLDWPDAEAVYLTLHANLAALLGNAAKARTAAQRSLTITESTLNVPFSIRNLSVLGFLELSRENLAGAHPFYERATSMALSGGYVDPGLFRFQADAVETLLAIGETERAQEVVDQLEAQGTELNRPWALVAAARGRGLLAAAARDLHGATHALDEALVHHERLEMPFELGRTLLVLGGVKRRLKQKRAARETLNQALELFEGLGATLWADKARGDLETIGGRAPAPTDLTPTEEHVARLAGDGLTNREIAKSLFMSAKTVERHLGHVFAKLGIRSRRELVRRRTGADEISGSRDRST